MTREVKIEMTKGISETAFASQVEDLLKLFQWRWTHFRPANTGRGWRTPLSGDKGLPDYIAVRPPRLIFAELKDQYSKPNPEQDAWLDDLRECDSVYSLKPEVYLWRPTQIDEIMEILR